MSHDIDVQCWYTGSRQKNPALNLDSPEFQQPRRSQDVDPPGQVAMNLRHASSNTMSRFCRSTTSPTSARTRRDPTLKRRKVGSRGPRVCRHRSRSPRSHATPRAHRHGAMSEALRRGAAARTWSAAHAHRANSASRPKTRLRHPSHYLKRTKTPRTPPKTPQKHPSRYVKRLTKPRQANCRSTESGQRTHSM